MGSIYIEITDGCYTEVENIEAESNSCGRNVPQMSLLLRTIPFGNLFESQIFHLRLTETNILRNDTSTLMNADALSIRSTNYLLMDY